MERRLQGLVAGILLGLLVSSVFSLDARGESQDSGSVGVIQNVEHINIMAKDGKQIAQNISEIFDVPIPEETSYRQVVFPAEYPHDPNAYPKFHTFRLPNVNLEIIEPVGGKSPWRDALDKVGGVAGFHHIEFDVQNMEAVIDRLKAKGVTQSLGDGKRFFAYMESTDLLGFALELNRVDAEGNKVDLP